MAAPSTTDVALALSDADLILQRREEAMAQWNTAVAPYELDLLMLETHEDADRVVRKALTAAADGATPLGEALATFPDTNALAEGLQAAWDGLAGEDKLRVAKFLTSVTAAARTLGGGRLSAPALTARLVDAGYTAERASIDTVDATPEAEARPDQERRVSRAALQSFYSYLDGVASEVFGEYVAEEHRDVVRAAVNHHPLFAVALREEMDYAHFNNEARRIQFEMLVVKLLGAFRSECGPETFVASFGALEAAFMRAWYGKASIADMEARMEACKARMREHRRQLNKTVLQRNMQQLMSGGQGSEAMAQQTDLAFDMLGGVLPDTLRAQCKNALQSDQLRGLLQSPMVGNLMETMSEYMTELSDKGLGAATEGASGGEGDGDMPSNLVRGMMQRVMAGMFSGGGGASK